LSSRVVGEHEFERLPVLGQFVLQLRPGGALGGGEHLRHVFGGAPLRLFTQDSQLVPVRLARDVVRVDERVADVDRALEHVAANQRDRVGGAGKGRMLSRHAPFDVGQAANQLVAGKRPHAEQDGEAGDEHAANRHAGRLAAEARDELTDDFLHHQRRDGPITASSQPAAPVAVVR
jgi:hypothetical protein